MLSVFIGMSIAGFLWLFDWAGTESTELALEVELVSLHLVTGGLLGALSTGLISKNTRLLRQLAISAVYTVAVSVLALLGMAARHPELFADRWWIIASPNLSSALDLACVLLLLGAAAVVAFRRFGNDARTRTKVAIATVAAILLWAAIGWSPNAQPFGPVNVLVIASESLDADRLEDPEVMPFAASQIPTGALYRNAFTPIARAYPSWVSTLTGTEPRIHDVRHRFPTVESRLEVGATLFTELRDEGYFTFAVSDAAGKSFSGFASGFERLDTPSTTVDAAARGEALGAHTWSLALLRLGLVRRLLPSWRSIASLVAPDWVVDDALHRSREASDRPFAGLVYFGTNGKQEPSGARFDAKLTAIDHATARLLEGVGENTLVLITGAHGKALDDQDHKLWQRTPILIRGPGVPKGFHSNAQVRLYDVPATILALRGGPATFGDGRSLFDEETARPRPICVETGLWSWPDRPHSLARKRLTYPEVSTLLETDPSTHERVLRAEMESLVESAKERGLILGHRLYREQPTPNGIERKTIRLDNVEPAYGDADLKALFESRCVEGDPHLSRLYGALVFERR